LSCAPFKAQAAEPLHNAVLAANRDRKDGYCTTDMSPSLRQVWQQLARSSWLFFPFTSSSSSEHDDKDAQQSSVHNRQRAVSPSSGTGSSEASTDPDRLLPLPLPLPLPVELDTNATIALAFLLGSATALGASTVYRRFFKRIRSAEWITPDVLRRKRWITGVVTRCVLS
jgi:hypothetical protein